MTAVRQWSGLKRCLFELAIMTKRCRDSSARDASDTRRMFCENTINYFSKCTEGHVLLGKKEKKLHLAEADVLSPLPFGLGIR